MTAKVIYLPLRKCSDCRHFDTPEDDEGLVAARCSLWNEPLDDERVGADCPDYEPDERTA